MQINQKNENGTLIIGINGDLDASSAIQLDEVFEKAFQNKQYNITVDFRQLNYISSAGVGVFISHLENMERNNGHLTLSNMKAHVFSVFEMLNLHKLIEILNTEQPTQSSL